MPSASEHVDLIFSALVPNRVDLLNKVLLTLTERHMPEEIYSNFWKMFSAYAEQTGGVLTRTALDDFLRSFNDVGRAARYLETYDSFTAKNVSEAEFTWSLSQIKDLTADEELRRVLTETVEVLRKGKEGEDGDLVRGHEVAREHLMESLAELDTTLNLQESPEGDMRVEARDMMVDYLDREKAFLTGQTEGIRFGIESLDAKLGGLQNGELVLSAGYSSDGKTSLCVQLAWAATVLQGKNVVFLTTETLRPQVRRKIIARHSVLEKFDIPDGLNTRDLKGGTLPEAGKLKLREVIVDFTQNPAYGKLYIAQVPNGATISYCEQILYRLQRQFPIDLVICDYLALFKASRRRNTEREELSSIVKEAKQLAVTFDDGRGVPFVSPWQVNRTSRDAAESVGYYTRAALAETAEATNSPDVIISILAPSDNSERRAEIKGQILKARDGETTNSLLFDVDYATSCFTSKASASTFTLFANGSQQFGTGGLDDGIGSLLG